MSCYGTPHRRVIMFHFQLCLSAKTGKETSPEQLKRSDRTTCSSLVAWGALTQSNNSKKTSPPLVFDIYLHGTPCQPCRKAWHVRKWQIMTFTLNHRAHIRRGNWSIDTQTHTHTPTSGGRTKLSVKSRAGIRWPVPWMDSNFRNKAHSIMVILSAAVDEVPSPLPGMLWATPMGAGRWW